MFAESLEQYSLGEIDYEDIKTVLNSILTSSPEMTTDIVVLLNGEQAQSLFTSTERQELLALVEAISKNGDNSSTRLVNQTDNVVPATEAEEISDDKPDSGATVLAETVIAPPPDPSTVRTIGQKSPDQLKPGDIIKGRFVLESLIGQGGMGIVFKARDMRKEEAMDRNPYVAIKVLGEALKDSPQALIALQRESRKAQTLAHPNIVTVFDFDRDGDIVYMTMEYLEGDPLDKLIKKHYPNPFEKEQALKIIDGICNGLAYAHSFNIIHSDLKPGNIYITKNNKVKIFDFGIARAMKKKEGDKIVDELTGETTLFDAGDLGGLTPAYASYEMLTGDVPDVRDDIYALACISYELLTGKHPFNKLPANQAKNRNLLPPPVPSLNRRQARGLRQALSFERKRRCPSVIKFQKDLSGKFNFFKALISATIVASITALIIASVQLMNYLEQQKISHIVNTLKSGSEQTILRTLASLENMEEEFREGVLTGGKEAVIKYYEQKVEQQTDTDNNKYNFKAADSLLDEAKRLYPDSAHIESIIWRINNRKNMLLNDITSRFNRHLEEEKLISDAKSDDIIDTLSEVALIDTDHPLLKDPRIPIAYTQAAQKAARINNLRYAEQLITTGLALFPSDVSLINMQDAIEAAKEISTDDANKLAILQRSLEKSIPAEQRKQTIEKLLEKPFKDRQWNGSLTVQFNYLKESVKSDDPWLIQHNDIIANIYLKQAQTMRKAARYTEASNIIRNVKKIIPANSLLLSEEKQIISAKMQYEKEQKEQAEIARIKGTKQTLLTQAQANDVKAARNSYFTLRKALPASDVFISTEAPKVIADAYLRLAQTSARSGDYNTATDLVKAGLQISPDHTTLQIALDSYEPKVSRSTSNAALHSDDPCQLSFAGHGKHARATCSDTLTDNAKGPTMIVIPPGSSINSAYAISKYEISIADYNLYCNLSKNCTEKTAKKDLPVTDISYSEAVQYSQWLSQSSGYIYRIPTESEWLHAANADGKQAQKDFNCQVSLGGNLVKGLALLNIHSGKANGWGLTNYIGNAQEWVLAEQSVLKARGGSYKDPLSSCKITLSRNHKGTPDNYTGFRLVRELKAGTS
ncbi:MAG: protein kinase [Gammaproteobacteria bacterium]|nr:protein kinase [Gammaproteobacteria bacterium]